MIVHRLIYNLFAWDRRTTPNVCTFHTPRISMPRIFIAKSEDLRKPWKLKRSRKLKMKSMLHVYEEKSWELQHTSRAFNTYLMRSKKHKRGVRFTWSCDRLHKGLVVVFHIRWSYLWLVGLHSSLCRLFSNTILSLETISKKVGYYQVQ